MSDDYLWDRSGAVDPEIAALERALASVDPPSAMPRAQVDVHVMPVRSRVLAVVLALAAALVLALGGWWWSMNRPSAPAAVPPIAALPDRESPPSPPRPRDRKGWIETGAETKSVEIAALGHVELDPNTRLREIAGAPGEHRYELERGRIHAKVDAPPRVFVVETPSAVAVDLGCQYTLEVDAHGGTRLEVSVGFVALEHAGRECIVPAGASCETRKGGAVGTTVRLDAPAVLQSAVRVIDLGTKRARGEAMATVVRESTAADAATLWHLLRYATAAERGMLFDRLAGFAAAPDGVTRERIVAGDDAMLRVWWDELGLGPPRRRGFRSPK